MHAGGSAEDFCNDLTKVNRSLIEVRLAVLGPVIASFVLIILLMCFCTCCCSCWCSMDQKGGRGCSHACTALGFGWYVSLLVHAPLCASMSLLLNISVHVPCTRHSVCMSDVSVADGGVVHILISTWLQAFPAAPRVGQARQALPRQATPTKPRIISVSATLCNSSANLIIIEWARVSV
jgi:hypothetical protein